MHGRATAPAPPPLALGRTKRAPLTRAFWVIVHRWAGLTLASFLVIAGVTGAIMPFEETLSYATRPDAAYAAPPSPGARPLDPVTLAERVERQTGGAVAYVPLEVPHDHVARIFLGPKSGGKPLSYDVVWADPYTGAIRLTYTFGGVTDGAQDIVPFLYTLHYGYVAGVWGMLAFGVAALVWTIDCFVGFGLSLPVARPAWWRRFGQAFKVRRWSGYKLTFDLHRAGGLWLWPLLLAFAWSGVALTLPQVETPVRRLLGGEGTYEAPALSKPLEAPPLDRRAAIRDGMAAIARIGARHGFAVERPSGLYYLPASGTYTVSARTTLDPSSEEGRTAVTLDARTGRVLHFAPPTGRAAADRVTAWMVMLHMAAVFGLPYRIFVSVLGIAVAVLSVTGVMIWQKKRGARRLHLRRAAPASRGPARAGARLRSRPPTAR